MNISLLGKLIAGFEKRVDDSEVNLAVTIKNKSLVIV
jgi:hypothetical protein